MVKTAVVVLNWNGVGFLTRFLPGLVEKSRSEGCRIFMADNGSTDNSVEWTMSELPEVEIIRMEMNLGFSGGYNEALAQIEAEYFILVNSDIEVTDCWIDPLVDHLDKHPRTAICQPKILSESRRDYFEYAGAGGGYIDKYGYPFCRGRIQDHIEKDTGQYDDPVPVFWASGA
ncbi:MAG: glycosyltransferase [Bacteroidales bacterium]